MYAQELFSCNARILYTSINRIQKKPYWKKKTLQKALTIIDPNKLLYLPWYPDVLFPSVAFNLLVPFLKKKWPLKKLFRDHFGPQVKFSGWNTVTVLLPV